MKTQQLPPKPFMLMLSLLLFTSCTSSIWAQDKPRGMGLILSSKQALSHKESIRIVPAKSGERPAKLELRRYMPPVGDQGAQGSCVGWSAAYYMYTYALAKRQKLTPEQLLVSKFQGSPAFIYNRPGRRWENGREVDPGMSLSEGIRILEEKGWANLADMPYNEKQADQLPDAAVLEKAARFRAQDIKVLPFEATGVEEIKTYLATVQIPIVLAIPVYSDFMEIQHKDPDFIYNPSPGASFQDLHAIAICGYDDARKAFLMINSWGPDFGSQGYLWLSEEFIRNKAQEAWGVKPGGRIPLGKPRVQIIPPVSGS